jgi:Tat protein secretion system quality control protein TatD with DNase activity
MRLICCLKILTRPPNEPVFLPFIVKYMAVFLGKTEEIVAAETTNTAKMFFNI